MALWRHVLLGISTAALVCGAGPALASEDAVPSAVPDTATATQLAEGWFHQLHGFDALEAYDVVDGRRRVAFALARKWKGDAVKILFRFGRPRERDRLVFLLLQRRDGGDILFVHLPRKVKSGLFAREPIMRIPASRLVYGGRRGIPIGEFRPFLPEELSHTRLPDTEVDGEPCYVVESRPTGIHPFGFDRLELALSHRTGVALRSRYFKEEKQLIEVRVSPDDVRLREGRWLPVERHIHTEDGEPTSLVLRNIRVDATLPDKLFTRHNMLVQRFPSF